MKLPVKLLITGFSALLAGLSFYDYRISFLIYLAIAPFLVILFSARGLGQAMVVSADFALIFYGTIFFWITIVSKWVGALGILAWVGTLLYPFIYLLGAGVILFLLRKSFLLRSICPPFIWVLMEWLQSLGPFGVTAGSLAYTQPAGGTIGQAAAYGGIYLVSFLIVIINVIIALMPGIYKDKPVSGSKTRLAITSVLLILGCFIAFSQYDRSYVKNLNELPLKVSIIQTNIPQAKKLSYGYSKEIFDRAGKLADLAGKKGTGLYIFPESLIPGLYENNRMVYFRLAARLNKGAHMVFGSDRTDGPRYFNSVFMADRYGRIINTYDKVRMVPFGEYVPLRKYVNRVLPLVLRNLGDDFSAGEKIRLFDAGSSGKFGVAVCFESIFPETFYNQHQMGSGYSIVVTNDGWFFGTSALKIHQNATAFRAVESRKQVLMCANTGISSVIMPSGQIRDMIAYDKSGFLSAQLLENHKPSFYYRHFYLLIKVSVLVTILSLIWVFLSGLIPATELFARNDRL